MFIVFEIQTRSDGTVGVLTDTYERLDQAESKYHSVLSYAAVSEIFIHTAMLVYSNGNVLKSESYTHDQQNENA